MARLEQRSLSNRVVDGLPAGDKEVIYWDWDLRASGCGSIPTG